MKFESILDFVFTRCLACGAGSDVVCVRCWTRLMESLESHELITVTEKPFVQRALFRWDEREVKVSNTIRDLILSAKESPSSKIVELWAAEFQRRAVIGLPQLRAQKKVRDWIITCPPGRSGVVEADHAGAMAQELAKRWNAPFMELLKRDSPGRQAQKTKSKAEREKIRFRSSEDWEIARGQGVLLIDDVIATGSTATAAWEALGRPRHFETWCVAWRVGNSVL